MEDEQQIPQRRDTDNVSIKTGLFNFAASGSNLTTIILLCAFVGGCGWFFGTYLNNHETTTANLFKEMREIKYILTLTDDERKNLHINMPESLRQQAYSFNR